jgi:hypothetical protein
LLDPNAATAPARPTVVASLCSHDITTLLKPARKLSVGEVTRGTSPDDMLCQPSQAARRGRVQAYYPLCRNKEESWVDCLRWMTRWSAFHSGEEELCANPHLVSDVCTPAVKCVATMAVGTSGTKNSMGRGGPRSTPQRKGPTTALCSAPPTWRA